MSEERISPSRQVGEAVGHTVDGTAFFGALMAGLLLGWILDSIFDTRPAFIIFGILAGAGVGFWRMWVNYTKAADRGH